MTVVGPNVDIGELFLYCPIPFSFWHFFILLWCPSRPDDLFPGLFHFLLTSWKAPVVASYWHGKSPITKSYTSPMWMYNLCHGVQIVHINYINCSELCPDFFFLEYPLLNWNLINMCKLMKYINGYSRDEGFQWSGQSPCSPTMINCLHDLISSRFFESLPSAMWLWSFSRLRRWSVLSYNLTLLV